MKNNIPLACSSASQVVPGCGNVLEIAVAGRHVPGAAREIENYISNAIAAHKPALLVIDFNRFVYEFGDDIGGALVSSLCRMQALGGPRACRIVATGATAASLEALLRFGKILPLFGGGLFIDFDSALSDAKSSSRPAG